MLGETQSPLQQQILFQIEKQFPNISYRKLAEMTGIQTTRVFRVLNGKEMRISEFEAFSRFLAKKTHFSEDTESTNIALLGIQCLSELPLPMRRKLTTTMNQKLEFCRRMHEVQAHSTNTNSLNANTLGGYK